MPEDPYTRGHVAGGIAERLDSHDRHFALINGSLGDVARELGGLRLAIQRLSDQAVSRDATVVATAAALKEADAARRVQAEQLWTPRQRVIAVVVALAGVGSLVIAALALVLSG